MRFTSVILDVEIPRLAPEKGLAAASTKFFEAERHKMVIELVGPLVRLSRGTAISYVPLSKVERFGPTLEEAAASAKATAATTAAE